jgi:threonine/homoserine/homoserine lactone efflux protein
MDRLKYIGYISLILNTVFLLIWITVFNQFANQNDRVAEFESVLLGKVSATIINVVLIGMTVIGIISLARLKSVLNKIVLILEVLFLCLFIFQYL